MSTSSAVNRVLTAPLSLTTSRSPSSLDVNSRAGDSLKSVGERYGASPEQMAKANPGVAGADRPLPPNARVAVPIGDGPGQAKAHSLAPGESVADVAKDAGVSEAALREANGFGAGQAIYPGTPLLLPQTKAKGGDPASPNALVAAFPGLDKYPQEKLAKISENLGALRSGDFAQKLEATAELVKDLPPAELPKLLQQAGVADKAIAKLVTDKDALEAVSKLADPKSSPTDKVAAALTLSNSIGGLAPGKLGDALKPFLAALPAGAKLADAVGKYLDPNASASDKAKAALDLANAAKDSLGNAFPQLSQKLRATDSFSRSIGAGLALIDPNAPPEDKAKAVVELTANVPELRGDAGRIGEFLRRGGVPNAQDVAREVERLPTASQFSEEVKKTIQPEVARRLTSEEADKLNKLAANPELKDGLAKTLKELKDPAAARALLSSLDGAGDDAAKKALLGTLSGLKEGVADTLLTSGVDGKPASEVLAKLTREFGPDGRDGLAKLVREFDGDALNALLRVADKTGVKAVEGMLKLDLDSKAAGAALKALDKILVKAGIELSPDIAARALRGIAKAVPAVGAAPAAYTAADLSAIAGDTQLPPAIRFLAFEGAKLNGADVLTSILEVTGAGALVDVPVGVAGLGIELIVQDQKAKFAADPGRYRTPDWLNTLNVGLAGSQTPPGTGVVELAAIYGPKGALEAIGSAARTGGKLGLHVAQAQAVAQANIVGDGLQLTAKGLHTLADVLRNPGKYGDVAEALGREAARHLAEAGASLGAIGKAARTELADVVRDLANRASTAPDSSAGSPRIRVRRRRKPLRHSAISPSRESSWPASRARTSPRPRSARSAKRGTSWPPPDMARATRTRSPTRPCAMASTTPCRAASRASRRSAGSPCIRAKRLRSRRTP